MRRDEQILPPLTGRQLVAMSQSMADRLEALHRRGILAECQLDQPLLVCHQCRIELSLGKFGLLVEPLAAVLNCKLSRSRISASVARVRLVGL